MSEGRLAMARVVSASQERAIRTFVKMIIAAAFLGPLASGSAMAQPPTSSQPPGGRAMGMTYVGMCDPGAVEALYGEVVSVERVAPAGRKMGAMMRRTRYGIHTAVKTGKETIPVHLGPAWYIENQAVKLAPGDKVQVKGSRITYAGKPALVAAQVRRGSEVLTLRDATGFPAWVGWRQQ